MPNDEANAQQSTNADNTMSSSHNAKHNVVRSAYYTPTVDEFHTGFEFQVDAGTGCSNQLFPKPWW